MHLVAFDSKELKKLSVPKENSHKGQNGKLLVIGGSHLFHSASLWSLQIASRIIDMVFYSSVPENNQAVLEAKKEFHDGIVVPRKDIENYIEESDCILIGPGMMRAKKEAHLALHKPSFAEITDMEDEGKQTYYLTRYLLEKYPQKKWVIDAGALQMMEVSWLKVLSEVILTPHAGEFTTLFGLEATAEHAYLKAKDIGCIILLKGQEDTVCSSTICVQIRGGNAGMTKGGTGDVLAGLVAALACKNDLFLAAKAGSYINKKAGEALFEKVGYIFNASDLVDQIPLTMKELLYS